jgi:hypothetical protein
MVFVRMMEVGRNSGSSQDGGSSQEWWKFARMAEVRMNGGSAQEWLKIPRMIG